MKMLKMLGITLFSSVVLVGCSNNETQGESKSSSIEQETGQVSTTSSSTIEIIPETEAPNPYALNEITDATNFKKGDFLIYEGSQETYLTDLIDIDDFSSNGLNFFNTQYGASLVGPFQPGELTDMFFVMGDEKAIFDESQTELSEATYIVTLFMETDITNTSEETLSFDGFSGYFGGEYDWTIPTNIQVDRDNVVYRDDSHVDVQAGNTVEDIPFMVLLATGKTPEEAVGKIPTGELVIKTAGISNENMDQLGGDRTIVFDLPQ